MNNNFARYISRLRKEQNLSQQQFAMKIYVDRSTISNWELGKRVPDATMITRIADALQVDVSILLNAARESDDPPNIILVDDEEIILRGSLPILSQIFPNASITGFRKASEALNYAQGNRISIAFLDIEIGNKSGLELCGELLKIDPCINVIFLTSYSDYSMDAWDTGACGFILKPLSVDNINNCLKRLRYPLLQ